MALEGAAGELYEALSPAFSALDTSGSLGRFCSVITGGDLELIHEWVTDTELGPGWQILLDPSRAPAILLPWLAQFDGAVLLPRMNEEEERLTITSPQAFGRGTVAQIEEVAKRGLTGTKTVVITERYTGSAWRMQIKTLPGETPDPVRLKAEIEAQAKPIGILLFFNEANAINWGELRTREASNTWLKTRTKYATWLAVRTAE